VVTQESQRGVRAGAWSGMPFLLSAAGLVIAIIALWRPGEVSALGPGHKLALRLPPWIMLVLVGAVVIAFFAIVSALIPAPRRKDPEDIILEPPPPPRLSPATLLGLLLLLAALIGGATALLFVFAPDLFSGSHGVAHITTASGKPAAPVPVPPQGRETAHTPTLDLGLTLTLSAVGIVIIVFALLVITANEPWYAVMEWFRFRRRRRRAPLAAEIASAMTAGIRDLGADNDPRRAIIACYQRCEAAVVAAQHGRRYASETPREYLQRALSALDLPAQSVRSLLAVFEHARFSDLPVTPRDCSIALGAFGDIRTTLEQRGSHAGAA
jgi:hypothetical protein